MTHEERVIPGIRYENQEGEVMVITDDTPLKERTTEWAYLMAGYALGKGYKHVRIVNQLTEETLHEFADPEDDCYDA